MLATSLLSCCLAFLPQEPLKIGVLARDAAGSSDLAFVRGVRRAADAVNAAGGVDGAKLEVVFEPVAIAKDVAPAIDKLLAAGAAALVAPPETHLAHAAQKAGDKVPVVAFDAAPAAIAAAIDRLVTQHLCMTRVALLRDRDKPAREFQKLLEKDGTLSWPATLLWDLEVTAPPKKVEKQFAEARPQLLVIDADPEQAQRFLDEHLAADPLPVVLTPRSCSEALLKQPRALFVVQGVSPAQVAADSTFRRDYERDHGTPCFGAAEGWESIAALAKAFEKAKVRDPAAVRAALHGLALEGVRGRYGFDAALGAFAPTLGVFLGDDDRLVPYTPLPVPLGVTGTAAGAAKPEERRLPQTGIGVPFGTWRTRQFPWEEGSQWVLCLWADDGGYATADADLQLLGLSTGGAAPIVDHLVKEEIFARVIAITSGKYGRNEDGTAIPGKSLRICFGAHLDEKARSKKKQRLWPARFGGDHEGAGGEAFGTFCRVYTMFIRRTIFQANALVPPVSAADREYLDGTYVFGSDFDKDKRSELIRALINSYSGSMALTLAHEVGHLCGLGHVTSDPAAIMNVEEGAGIDYPQAHFCPESRAILEKQLGVVGETAAKKR